MSLKSTEPVGVPAPGALAVTVASKVIAWPRSVLAAVALIVVVVGSW